MSNDQEPLSPMDFSRPPEEQPDVERTQTIFDRLRQKHPTFTEDRYHLTPVDRELIRNSADRIVTTEDPLNHHIAEKIRELAAPVIARVEASQGQEVATTAEEDLLLALARGGEAVLGDLPTDIRQKIRLGNENDPQIQSLAQTLDADINRGNTIDTIAGYFTYQESMGDEGLPTELRQRLDHISSLSTAERTQLAMELRVEAAKALIEKGVIDLDEVGDPDLTSDTISNPIPTVDEIEETLEKNGIPLRQEPNNLIFRVPEVDDRTDPRTEQDDRYVFQPTERQDDSFPRESVVEDIEEVEEVLTSKSLLEEKIQERGQNPAFVEAIRVAAEECLEDIRLTKNPELVHACNKLLMSEKAELAEQQDLTRKFIEEAPTELVDKLISAHQSRMQELDKELKDSELPRLQQVFERGIEGLVNKGWMSNTDLAKGKVPVARVELIDPIFSEARLATGTGQYDPSTGVYSLAWSEDPRQREISFAHERTHGLQTAESDRLGLYLTDTNLRNVTLALNEGLTELIAVNIVHEAHGQPLIETPQDILKLGYGSGGEVGSEYSNGLMIVAMAVDAQIATPKGLHHLASTGTFEEIGTFIDALEPVALAETNKSLEQLETIMAPQYAQPTADVILPDSTSEAPPAPSPKAIIRDTLKDPSLREELGDEAILEASHRIAAEISEDPEILNDLSLEELRAIINDVAQGKIGSIQEARNSLKDNNPPPPPESVKPTPPPAETSEDDNLLAEMLGTPPVEINNSPPPAPVTESVIPPGGTPHTTETQRLPEQPPEPETPPEPYFETRARVANILSLVEHAEDPKSERHARNYAEKQLRELLKRTKDPAEVYVIRSELENYGRRRPDTKQERQWLKGRISLLYHQEESRIVEAANKEAVIQSKVSRGLSRSEAARQYDSQRQNEQPSGTVTQVGIEITQAMRDTAEEIIGQLSPADRATILANNDAQNKLWEQANAILQERHRMETDEEYRTKREEELAKLQKADRVKIGPFQQLARGAARNVMSFVNGVREGARGIPITEADKAEFARLKQERIERKGREAAEAFQYQQEMAAAKDRLRQRIYDEYEAIRAANEAARAARLAEQYPADQSQGLGGHADDWAPPAYPTSNESYPRQPGSPAIEGTTPQSTVPSSRERYTRYGDEVDENDPDSFPPEPKTKKTKPPNSAGAATVRLDSAAGIDESFPPDYPPEPAPRAANIGETVRLDVPISEERFGTLRTVHYGSLGDVQVPAGFVTPDGEFDDEEFAKASPSERAAVFNSIQAQLSREL